MDDLRDFGYHVCRRVRLSADDTYLALGALADAKGRIRAAAPQVRIDLDRPLRLGTHSAASPVARSRGLLRPRGRVPIRVQLEVDEWADGVSELGLLPRVGSVHWWTAGRAWRYFEAGADVLTGLVRRLENVGDPEVSPTASGARSRGVVTLTDGSAGAG